MTDPGPSGTRVPALTDRLVTAIATGEFLPGSRLPAERELAVLLGVGRTSVRAALAALHAQGLIETQRGRGGGSFVRTQWTADSHAAVLRTLDKQWGAIQDRLEAMRRIQGTVARAAAELRDEHDVEVLELRLTEYRFATTGRGKQHADAALHLAIADAAKNETLRAVQLRLEAEISIGAPTHVWGEPDGMLDNERRGLAEHEALIAAIRDGRADDAEAVAREHGRLDQDLLEAARRRAEQAASVSA